MGKWLSENWQTVVFAIIGFVFMFFSITFIMNDRVADASGVFAISFLCFLYANLSRFKRFKGLGFEAELWEDKQKEAADLIDRLKSIVSIYTTQTVMNAVTKMRFGGTGGWRSHWKLYDDLVGQHEALGQRIDFSQLKRQVDDYFLFDLCRHNTTIRQRIVSAKAVAHSAIEKEFGKVISDNAGHSKRIEQLREIKEDLEPEFDISGDGNLAREMLTLADRARAQLKEGFNVDVDFDQEEIAKLRRLEVLYDRRPVVVTEELILLSERPRIR